MSILKNIFAVIGVIWISIIILNMILVFINSIINKKNLDKFKKTIKENKTLEQVFEKLTPEEIEKLKNGEKVESSIDIIKKTDNSNEENTKKMIEKYKMMKVDDIESFAAKLNKKLNEIVEPKEDINTYDKWYCLLNDKNEIIRIISFVKYNDYMFIQIANIYGFHKIIQDTIGFNNIDKLFSDLKDEYKYTKIIREN